MAKPKWSTKPAEITAVVDATGSGFVVRVPLYDNGVKQGTMVWSMSDRHLSAVFEQITGTTPIDFDGGAWTKVV